MSKFEEEDVVPWPTVEAEAEKMAHKVLKTFSPMFLSSYKQVLLKRLFELAKKQARVEKKKLITDLPTDVLPLRPEKFTVPSNAPTLC